MSRPAVEVEVEVLLAGEARMPPAYVFRPRRRLAALPSLLRPAGESLRAPLLSYVVRHPDAGAILVDTGLHPDAARSLRGDYGPLLGAMLRSVEPHPRPFEEQLRDHGVEPGEVELTVMTHLHLDHTGGMRLLPRSEFVCDAREWAATRGRAAVAAGYVAKHLPDASRMRLLDFGAEGTPHGPFGRTIDLLDDGSVRLISTPGHTHGHLSVLLATREGDVLLVGDAAYTLRNIEDQTLPYFTASDDRYRRSLAEVKAYADANPDATLVPTHDAEAWRAVAAAGR